MQQQGEQAWRRSTQRNFHQHLQLYSFPDVSLWMTRMSTCCGCLREKLYRHRSFQQSLRRFQVRDICGQFSVPFVGVSCPFHFSSGYPVDFDQVLQKTKVMAALSILLVFQSKHHWHSRRKAGVYVWPSVLETAYHLLCFPSSQSIEQNFPDGPGTLLCIYW